MTAGAVFDSCIVGDADPEGVCLREAPVAARKPYLCCECYRTIRVGERHWYAGGVFPGEGWWNERTCETCHRVRESVMRGSWCYGELWSNVADAYCHSDEDREAMLPESYLHPAKHRCRTEHVQDCDHCDDWWCGDNISDAARKYRERYPGTNPYGGAPNASV